MNASCPFCEQETKIEKCVEIENMDIRGEAIPVTREYYHCEVCSEEFEVLEKGYDPYAEAYREYRRRKGWPQPGEIKDFRKAMGLTQQQFSDLLGIGVATINRYENGALQSESNNQLISLCINDPWVLIQFTRSNPEALTESELQDLKSRIIGLPGGLPQLMLEAVEQYGSYDSSLLSGCKTFDFEKFFQVAGILCYDTKQFTTKLLKLLFYVDFKHFKDYGVSITGMRYVRNYYGPVPSDHTTWLAAFTDWLGVLEQEPVNFDDFCGETLSATRTPDFNQFSAEEIKTIQTVLEKFKGYSSRDIVKFSHQEKGYLETGHRAVISYDFAKDLQI